MITLRIKTMNSPRLRILRWLEEKPTAPATAQGAHRALTDINLDVARGSLRQLKMLGLVADVGNVPGEKRRIFLLTGAEYRVRIFKNQHDQ